MEDHLLLIHQLRLDNNCFGPLGICFSTAYRDGKPVLLPSATSNKIAPRPRRTYTPLRFQFITPRILAFAKTDYIPTRTHMAE